MAALTLPKTRPPEIGSRFRLTKQLGKGSYGTVFLVKERARGDGLGLGVLALLEEEGAQGAQEGGELRVVRPTVELLDADDAPVLPLGLAQLAARAEAPP